MNRDGEMDVETLRVLEGLHEALDKHAVEAIDKCRFRPRTLQGKPARELVGVQVLFKAGRKDSDCRLSWRR